jgi:hypothetical protein
MYGFAMHAYENIRSYGLGGAVTSETVERRTKLKLTLKFK